MTMPQADSDIRNSLLVARLPAMPQILLKLIEQCQTEAVGMGELADLVAQDPGMTSKILAVANSSAYHRDTRRTGLEQSVMTLGADMIKTLVISQSVFQVFNNFSHAKHTDLRAFWKHSLSAAVMARAIAEQTGYSQVEEAYLGGLLHDVGRLALLSTAPDAYAANFLARDDEALCAAEQDTLNITHSEAGAWLIGRWNLDSFLADSALYHHEPVARLETAHPLVRIVLLAHLLSNYGDDDATVKAAGLLCGIEAADLQKIVAGASSQVKKSAEYLGIDLSGVDDLIEPGAAPPPDAVQQQLSDEVRNLVLVSEAGRSFERQQGGENALLEAISRSARILFDFEDTIILLLNARRQALVGAPVGEGQQRLAEFSIALGGGGAIAAAAVQGRPAFIGNSGNPLWIAEQQLLRVLASDTLVCVPLIAGAACLGVLIGGVGHFQVAGLQARERFLLSFGEQAAAALETARGERGEAARRAAGIGDEFREATRRVVHEVNNPLSIIKNYLGVLDRKLEKSEPVVGEISILNEEIDRVGQIINGLADLKAAPRETGSEVNRVVRDTVRLFHDTEYLPAGMQIVANTMDLPCQVESGADVLKQILVNLVRNAIEAMPAGGEIEIASSGQVNRDGRLYAEVCVKDSGPGMPPEVLSHIFAPVRSTKGEGHQGLGLSIVYGLVKQTRGFIACRSSHKGTSFEMLFPVREVADPGAALSDSGAGR
jgi:HD-like signal output (HDOD) protein/signal transduction histidine kinase